MKNSRLSVIAFWLLVPVVAFVVIVKMFHIYPPRHIFQWLFLLPYISVILSIAALFHRHTKRTLAIVNLVFCLAAYAPIGIPKAINSINNNFNLNIPVNKYGMTPLHKAAQYGDIAKVKRILQKNVDVNIKTSNGYTPLMFAARRGNVKLVEYLISKGADPSIQNKYGQTALTNAVIKNHIKVVQKLIESGADSNFRSATYASSLEIACSSGFTEVFNLLINNGADFKQVHKDHSTLLYRVGNLEIAKKLIELGLNPNTTGDHGDTPLHWWNVKADIAALLIKSGANVNAKNEYGDTPLHKAGNIETIKLLVKNGADINAKNKDGCTPLINHINKARIAKTLIELGADASLRTKAGNTALHFVKNLEVARLLIKKGVNVNAKNTRGDTPLHRTSSVEITKLLVENGANPNLTNNLNQTPIFGGHNDKKKIYLIQNAGADVHVVDERGESALFYVCSAELVDLLIEKGLNPNAIDKMHHTPLDESKFSTRSVRQALKKHGAMTYAKLDRMYDVSAHETQK